MSDEPNEEPADATQHFPAPQPPSGGWVIGGRYRVIDRIGSGGMADVMRAHDESLDRDVAVKVFRTATAADTAAGAERQRAELHALARLNHPNLITLYDGSLGGPGQSDSRAYLVMELVQGPNLGDRIDRGPLPSEPEVRLVGAQIADALAYVHAQGMVHRDIKPANILLGSGTGTEQIRARLSDFGIVRLLGAERLTQADSTLGTASYLAPEQARGSGVGPAADVYALGLTLVEALTGIRSFDGPTPLEAVVARLERDPEIPPNLPAPWPGLLRAMTARDPDARPSAQQVSAALRGTGTSNFPAAAAAAAAAAGTTVLPSVAPAAAAVAPGGPPPSRVSEAIPVGPLGPRDEPRRRNTGLLVGVLLALVLLGLGAVILIATTGGDSGPGDTADPTTSATSGPSSESSARRTRQRSSDSSSRASSSRSSSSQDESSSQSRPESSSSSRSSSSQRTSSSPPSSSSSSRSSSSSSSPQAVEPPLSSSSSDGGADANP